MPQTVPWRDFVLASIQIRAKRVVVMSYRSVSGEDVDQMLGIARLTKFTLRVNGAMSYKKLLRFLRMCYAVAVSGPATSFRDCSP